MLPLLGSRLPGMCNGGRLPCTEQSGLCIMWAREHELRQQMPAQGLLLAAISSGKLCGFIQPTRVSDTVQGRQHGGCRAAAQQHLAAGLHRRHLQHRVLVRLVAVLGVVPVDVAQAGQVVVDLQEGWVGGGGGSVTAPTYSW